MNRVVLTILAALAVAGTAVWMFQNKQSTSSRFMMTSLPTPAYDAWNHWKQKFGKTYGTPTDETYRQGVWYQNFQAINKNNGDNTGYTMAMNEFGDLDTQEFATLKFGLMKPAKKATATLYANPQYQAASSVDWRTKAGVLAPVQNQGSCGSCWAFSATAAIESGAAVKNGKPVTKLSEQQLVDCSKAEGNQGCNGGLMDQAFTYVEKHGMTSEDNYPYRGSDNTCTFKDGDAVTKMNAFVDVEKNDDALVQAVAITPVSIGVAANAAWQFYFTGVLPHWACSGTQANHGVVLVGYTDSYWIVRNSWGASWGHSGYIYLKKGYNTCGIRDNASYPTF